MPFFLTFFSIKLREFLCRNTSAWLKSVQNHASCWIVLPKLRRTLKCLALLFSRFKYYWPTLSSPLFPKGLFYRRISVSFLVLPSITNSPLMSFQYLNQMSKRAMYCYSGLCLNIDFTGSVALLLKQGKKQSAYSQYQKRMQLLLWNSSKFLGSTNGKIIFSSFCPNKLIDPDNSIMYLPNIDCSGYLSLLFKYSSLPRASILLYPCLRPEVLAEVKDSKAHERVSLWPSL